MQRSFWGLLCALLFITGVVQAAPSFTAMKKQIVCDCPDCGRQTIDQCASGCERGRELAAALKTEISAGKSEDQIFDYFAVTYGEHVLGVPRQQNFWGRMAPIMPFAILLLGLVPISYIMKTRHHKVRQTGGKKAPSVASGSDERLDAALKDFDY
jgi:cytochrome c-type biogenesis protein CcmH/NrfF